MTTPCYYHTIRLLASCGHWLFYLSKYELYDAFPSGDLEIVGVIRQISEKE